MSDHERPDPVIRADAVSVSIEESTLLAPTTMTASAGQIVALRGANGAGKTTALRLLAGELHPTTGTVEVLGRTPDERDASFRSEVAGLLGGNLPLAPNLTLAEQLRLVLISWGQDPQRAQEWLGRMRLSALADRFAHELSSGQRQMYTLTLALARPSTVLLLDEPEQRLDQDRLGLLIQALREKAAAGVTVVMATHREELATATGARQLTLVEADDEGDDGAGDGDGDGAGDGDDGDGDGDKPGDGEAGDEGDG